MRRAARPSQQDGWSVLPDVRSRADVLAYLRWHERSALWLQLPLTVRARRRHVEQVRPALRWLCRRFRVPVPPWLTVASDVRFAKLPQREFVATFGPTRPLVIREFAP
jgi:hypothetical protein